MHVFQIRALEISQVPVGPGPGSSHVVKKCSPVPSVSDALTLDVTHENGQILVHFLNYAVAQQLLHVYLKDSPLLERKDMFHIPHTSVRVSGGTFWRPPWA